MAVEGFTVSTGADAKTMPVTEAYASEHERIFGERERPTGERRLYVSRCSICDGVFHEPKALLFDCRRCGGKDCYGLVDAIIAPPLREENEARCAPIMVDRFMEGTQAQDGADISSRKRRRDYLKATGATDASDYGPGYGDRIRASKERELRKETRETIGRILHNKGWKP